MLIRKKRVRSVNRQLRTVRPGDRVVPALTNLENHRVRLQTAGLRTTPDEGDTVLPTPVGPVSQFNAEGRYMKHKDQPMETVYRQRLWTHQEWRGPYREEVTDVVDVPYHRYPRTFVEPPSVELTVRRNTRGELLVVGPAFEYSDTNNDDLLHTINLFLELFGECDVLQENLDEIIVGRTRRLNWEVLPPGQYPWPAVEARVRPLIDRQAEDVRPVIRRRLETVNNYGPEFVAVGRAGFEGYLVFAFPDRNLYVLESVHPDNATYVFTDDWEELSQKTKAEILSQDLQHDRIIHRRGWDGRVASLLGEAEAM